MFATPHIRPLYPMQMYAYPNRNTVAFQQSIIDVKWYETWPTIRSIFLGGMLMLTSAAIIGLDIANLAIEGGKAGGSAMLGAGTAKVGAGIWSGSITFLAALFIIAIIFVRNKRIAATIALFAVILAFFFSIVLVGLSSNAVQLDQYYGDSVLSRTQYKLMCAIIALSAFNVTLCIAFFIMYTLVYFSSATRPSMKH